jgi:hypothetical protein
VQLSLIQQASVVKYCLQALRWVVSYVLPMCRGLSCELAIEMHSCYRNQKHPLSVVISSALCECVYHPERIVHFDSSNPGCVYLVGVGRSDRIVSIEMR